jgi:hypothetical protein
MQNYLRTSDTDAALGLSPFEFGHGNQGLSWPQRLLNWIGRWARRLLPFLFVLTLGAEEVQAPIRFVPDSIQAKYQKARADLALAAQEATLFCRGDFGFATDGRLACVPDKPEEKR